LDDGLVFGAEDTNITLGVNWHMNKQVRFMRNHILVDIKTVAGDEDLSATQVRGQMDF
jgi:phosphate-selective porin